MEKKSMMIVTLKNINGQIFWRFILMSIESSSINSKIIYFIFKFLSLLFYLMPQSKMLLNTKQIFRTEFSSRKLLDYYFKSFIILKVTMLRSYILIFILACLIQVLAASAQSDNFLQKMAVVDDPEITNKSILLKLAAFKDIGLRYDSKFGYFTYDTNGLFFDKALLFLRRVLEDYRYAIQRYLGIAISPDFSQQIEKTLETKLGQIGFTPLREFLLEVYELSDQLGQLVNKNLTSDQEQALATRLLFPLDRLYERTYGTFFKQPRKDKYNIMINGQFYGDGLKQTIDARREVYGMKKISQMPQTFRHFHSRAARYSSQYDQDGVIQAIFQAISPKYNCSKYFVEIGGGSQVDNTAYLRQRKNWTGHLFNSGTYYMGRTGYPITNEYVGPLNAVEIFQKYNISKNFDFLSIDVDTRDCCIWSALVNDYKPAVVSIQFNVNFSPYAAVSQPLLSASNWGGDKLMGCSSRASYEIAIQNGYGLVYHHAFTDIFYVRKQLLPDQLPPIKLEEVFDAIPIHQVDVQFKKYEVFMTNKLQLYKAKLKIRTQKVQREPHKKTVPQIKNMTSQITKKYPINDKVSHNKSMDIDKPPIPYKSLTPDSQDIKKNQTIIPESQRIPKNRTKTSEISLPTNNKSKVLQNISMDNKKDEYSDKEVSQKNIESPVLPYITFLFGCAIGALTAILYGRCGKKGSKQNINLQPTMQLDENNQEVSMYSEREVNKKEAIVIINNI